MHSNRCRSRMSATRPRPAGSLRGWSAAPASTKPRPATVALIVTELATNILKHAKRGEILMRLLDRGDTLGVEFLSLDQGPGIANLTQCFRDGYSTAGSPGTGLGAIARLADEFDMHTIPGKGTAVLARLWPKNAKRGNLSRYRVRHRLYSEVRRRSVWRRLEI